MKKVITLEQAIRQRHSVRSYESKSIDEKISDELNREIEKINSESGLHFQLLLNRPEAFDSFLARYGGFKNVRNYFALVGSDDGTLDEKCGYYGEKLVLSAQRMGLSTCWIGGSFSRKKAAYEAEPGEKLCLIISVGYAADEGKAHKSKDFSSVVSAQGDIPDWFRRGVELSLLAPTALNRQKFLFIFDGANTVSVKAGRGPFSGVDLGIVKYHFETGAGKDNFNWA